MTTETATLETLSTAQLADWLWQQKWSDFAQSLASYYVRKGTLTEKQEAAARKMHAKVTAKKVQPTATEWWAKDDYVPAVNDVHVIDGDFYRVHKSQHGGYLYGAVWDAESKKFLGPRYDARAKGLLKRVNKTTLATAEQAAAFGHVNEQCVFCSHKIDTPESKTVGYGPKCAADRGLPWG